MLPSAFRKQQAQNPTAKTAGSDINYLLLDEVQFMPRFVEVLNSLLL